MAEWKVRFTQIALLFLSFTVAYMIRTCMSVGVIAMTDASMMKINKVKVFDWPKEARDYILSSFYWGYICMQIPAGHLAYKYGGKILIGFALLSNGLLSLIIPAAGKYGGWKAVVGCRILQGVFQGCIFPSIHTLISKWCPLNERNRMGNFVFMGGNFGTILAMPITGLLPNCPYGWPSVFYVIGFISILMCIIWFIYAAESPTTHKTISVEESNFIIKSLGEMKYKKRKTPWKSMMTSLPLAALFITHITCAWGFITMLTQIPSFFHMALGISVEMSSIYTAIAYVVGWIISTITSILADTLVNKKLISPTFARKLSNTIGSWGPAFCMILITLLPLENKAIIILFIVLVVALDSVSCTGFLINHIDLSPNYASLLISFTNSMAIIVSNMSPIVTGMFVNDNPNDIESWYSVFYLSACTYFIGNLIFIIFGTAEKQPWDDENLKSQNEEKEVIPLNNIIGTT